ncbi:MAG: hypothetical protein N2516_04170, partial [Dictyoglomaceae bacterium]|nr:hypothetical protein [Dictyoglomaceae bacterium]
MPTINKEELEYLLQMMREIIKQEIDTRIPIHAEIVDLKLAVKELIEAQRKTEERLNALAEAQRKTEERLERLEKAFEELIEAQRKTEERLNALAEAQRRTEERLNALAEAQRKTEERLNALAEAQRKTEERLNALAEAQRRTEEELRSLTLVVKDLQRQVGGISHSVGFDLENQSYKYLPNLLKRDFGIVVKERLIRKFIKNKKGQYLEINIIGKGEREGKEINIIGEAKTNLSLRHIEDFIDRLKDIREVIE